MSTVYFSLFFSATDNTALTTISANFSESFLTSFVCIEVFAILSSDGLSFAGIFSAISSKNCFAFLAAFL
jgi:hypothetical protein